MNNKLFTESLYRAFVCSMSIYQLHANGPHMRTLQQEFFKLEQDAGIVSSVEKVLRIYPTYGPRGTEDQCNKVRAELNQLLSQAPLNVAAIQENIRRLAELNSSDWPQPDDYAALLQKKLESEQAHQEKRASGKRPRPQQSEESSGESQAPAPKVLSQKRINHDLDKALVKAINQHDLQLVRKLFESDIIPDVNAKWFRNETVLMGAVEGNQFNTVQELIKQGADINYSTPKGKKSALGVALSDRHDKIAKLLIEAGVDVNADIDGFADNRYFKAKPLLFALYNNSLYIIDALLQAQGDINVRLLKGATPLMIASERLRPNVVKYLLQHEADVNAKDQTGKTALMLAAMKKNEHFYEYYIEPNAQSTIINLLIQAGADVNAKDQQGRTFRDYLQQQQPAQPTQAAAEEAQAQNPLQTFIARSSGSSAESILGVPANADKETINKSFRAASIKYHPDKWPHEEQLASEAYKILVNARDQLLAKIPSTSW